MESILILSTHLRLGLPSGSFPPVSPPRPYTPLSSPVHASCPAHLILLDFITRTLLGEEYKSFSSSLCNLLHSPVTSCFLGPNILLNTIFSNTLSFLPSRNVNDYITLNYIMGPQSYMRSVVDRNVVMRRVAVLNRGIQVVTKSRSNVRSNLNYQTFL